MMMMLVALGQRARLTLHRRSHIARPSLASTLPLRALETAVAATAENGRAQRRDRAGPTLACPRDRTVAILTERLDASHVKPACHFIYFYFFCAFFFILRLLPRPGQAAGVNGPENKYTLMMWVADMTQLTRLAANQHDAASKHESLAISVLLFRW